MRASLKFTRRDWLVSGAAAPCVASSTPCGAIGGRVMLRLTIPLDTGDRCRLHDVLRALAQQIGAPYDLELTPDCEYVLTPSQGRQLLLGNAFSADTGIEVEITDTVVTLWVADRTSQAERTRQRLERWFGVRLDSWPDDYGPQVSASFDPRRPIAVLVHGFQLSPASIAGLARRASQTGVQVLNFRYPNDGPLAVSGAQVGRRAPGSDCGPERIAKQQSHLCLHHWPQLPPRWLRRQNDFSHGE